jgi:hypothetical protein
MMHIRWKPPDSHQVKINLDASDTPSNDAATGFIIRDQHGNPIIASTRNIGKASMLVTAYSFEIVFNWQHVQVEDDSERL